MLAMMGAVAGFFTGMLMPHRYVARTTLRLVRAAGMPQGLYDGDSRRMADSARTPALTGMVISALLTRDAHARDMLAFYNTDELNDRIRAGSRTEMVSLPGGINGILVEYEDEDPEFAVSVDRELARAVGSLAASANPAGDQGSATELSELPHAVPVGATIPLMTGVGFALGALLGLLASLAAPREASEFDNSQ